MIRRKIDLVGLAVVLLAGIFLRLPPSLFSGGSAPPRSIAYLVTRELVIAHVLGPTLRVVALIFPRQRNRRAVRHISTV